MFKTLSDLDNIHNQRALVRVDLNIPMQDGEATDLTRLEAIKPTLQKLSDKGARTILIAHFGRPKGEPSNALSLKAVIEPLSNILGQKVVFLNEDARAQIDAMEAGAIGLLENIRFDKEEEENAPLFAQALASLGDFYVNDAFSCAHRAHASTVGLAQLLPSFAGLSMEKELSTLDKALSRPESPVIAVVGGAKVSTKLDLLNNLVKKVDTLIVGGGMANTFLAAQGINVQKSLCEHDLLETARTIIDSAKKADCQIILPEDVVCAKEFAANAAHTIEAIENVPEGTMILDAGPKTIKTINKAFDNAKTLVWNGPLGAFEIEPFDQATVKTAQHAANLSKQGKLMAVAGGGDTVSALNHAQAAQDFSYISTAGGAFLEWLEGKPLPGVEALKTTSKAA